MFVARRRRRHTGVELVFACVEVESACLSSLGLVLWQAAEPKLVLGDIDHGFARRDIRGCGEFEERSLDVGRGCYSGVLCEQARGRQLELRAEALGSLSLWQKLPSAVGQPFASKS